MSDRYFIYTGNAYPHKNLSRLIEAVVLLNQDRKEKIILKICSSRSVFTQRLEDLIKNKNAKEYIELLGFISDKDIKNLYKKSVAFAFPTLAEGFGLPPIEAIDAGALVVLSDIPVLREVYQDSVSYFDPLSVESIKNALEDVFILNGKQKNKRVKFSQDFVKRYSWAKMARETLNIYEKEGSASI